MGNALCRRLSAAIRLCKAQTLRFIATHFPEAAVRGVGGCTYMSRAFYVHVVVPVRLPDGARLKLRCNFPDDAATAVKAVVRTPKSRFAIEIAVRVQHWSS